MFLVAVGDVIYGLAVYGFQFLFRGRTDILFISGELLFQRQIYTC